MTAPGRILELACLAVMALWLLGSVLYALPVPGLRRRLERCNAGLWFANWTVFGAGNERAEIARYTLRFRDCHDEGAGEWTVVISGRRWVWHACLWQPERRLADRVQRIGQDIARALEHAEGERRVIAPRRALLARHLDATRPRAPGRTREVQLLEERSVVGASEADGTTERVILAFTLPPDDSGI